MSSSSHVTLHRPVIWSFPPSTSTRLFYDNFHGEIIIVTENSIYVSDFILNNLYNFNIDVNIDIRVIIDTKFSPLRDYILIQISQSEIRIYNSIGEFICYQTCRTSKYTPPIIVGSYWLGTLPYDESSSMLRPKSPNILNYCYISQSDNFADYFLVTNIEIEFYKVSIAKIAKKPIKNISTSISYHWYLPSSQFLFTVDNNNIFSGYIISSKGITLISKFEFNFNPNETPLNSRNYYHQISLHVLYGKISLLFVNEKKGNLLVYSLQNTSGVWSFSLTYTLPLFSTSRFEVSVLDELIIVHSLHTKVPMLYDVRTSEMPIVAPLPMRLISGKSVTTYPKSWYFLSPCFILDYDKSGNSVGGSMWCLKLEHNAIANAWGAEKREKLFDYLLKRRGTKWSILALLRQWLREFAEGSSTITLAEITNLFLMINRINYTTLQDDEEADLSIKAQTYSSSIENSPLSISHLLHSSLTRVSSNKITDNTNLQNEQDAALCTQFLYSTSLVIEKSTESPDTIIEVKYSEKEEDISFSPLSDSEFVYHDLNSKFQSKLIIESNDNNDVKDNKSQSSFRTCRSSSPDLSSPYVPTPVIIATPRSQTFERVLSPSPSPSPPRQRSIRHVSTSTTNISNIELVRAGWCDEPDVQVFQAFISFFYPNITYNSCDAGPVPLHKVLDVLPPIHVLSQFLTETHSHGFIYISHLDIYLFILSQNQMILFLTEFMKTCAKNLVEVDFCLQRFLVDLLAENDQLSILQQLLQYHILSDSRPLALQLVRLSESYEPLFQLGIDMLYRLKSNRDVITIFLQRGAVLEALKTLQFQSPIFDIPGTKPRDFLSAACNLNKFVFYAVYKYFEDRNVALKFTTLFDDDCKEYVDKFNSLFIISA